MAKFLDDDALDELIRPVCEIADLKPTKDWPPQWRKMIAAARAVKTMHGFHVETMSTNP